MPPVSAHNLAWQGSPVMIDVHAPSQPRLRVASHTNEYVGALRAKVARLMGGACPKRVRLLHAGERREPARLGRGQGGLGVQG